MRPVFRVIGSGLCLPRVCAFALLVMIATALLTLSGDSTFCDMLSLLSVVLGEIFLAFGMAGNSGFYPVFQA